MYNMLEDLRDKAQRFTPSEIQAELLRQDIQLIESAEPKDINDPQRIEALKQRLADIEEPSQLQAQGRVLMSRYINMMDEIGESYEVPSDADEVLEEYRKWMDAVEAERRRRHLRHLISFKQSWPVADWERRGRMLRWLGRCSIRRFANEKPRYHLGRAAMGWATTMVKKRW